MSADVRGFFAAIGVELPARGGANLDVRCFANPGAHKHGDRKPACSVDVERGLWHCHVCGAKGNAYQAVLACGRQPAEAMELLERYGLDADRNGRPPAPARERYFVYEDENRQPLHRTVRVDDGRGGKEIWQERRGDVSGWVKGLGNTRRVLYRLPEVRAAAEAGETVWIPEGEPCADALAGLDLVATTNPMGAGKSKWLPEYAEMLRGAGRVIVLPDDDTEGREHADRVARSAATVVDDVRVVELYPLGETKRDVVDFLEPARTPDERQQAAALLRQFAEQAPPYQPTAPGPVLSTNESSRVLLENVAKEAAPEPELERVHSWLPRPLVGAPPVEPPSICRLLYPGKRHLLSGESDAGKSMALHYWQAEEIRAGRCVLHLDFEQGPAETLQRLLALGLTEQEIEERFLYVAPDEPVHDLLPDLLAVIEERRPSIVSFDSFGNLAVLHGLNDNDRQDVGHTYRTIIEPTARYGAAAVVLDHVAKDPSSDKYAIGSERKVGIPDVHLRAECAVQLGRGRKGLVKIIGKRDRSGYLRKGKLAEITFDSDPDGRIQAAMTLTDENGGVWRPTVLMERVSRYLDALGETGASQNAVEQDVTGNGPALRQALTVLVIDSYVVEKRDGQARIFTSVRPFREASE